MGNPTRCKVLLPLDFMCQCHGLQAGMFGITLEILLRTLDSCLSAGVQAPPKVQALPTRYVVK